MSTVRDSLPYVLPARDGRRSLKHTHIFIERDTAMAGESADEISAHETQGYSYSYGVRVEFNGSEVDCAAIIERDAYCVAERPWIAGDASAWTVPVKPIPVALTRAEIDDAKFNFDDECRDNAEAVREAHFDFGGGR